MFSNKRGNSLKLRQIPAKSNSREAILFLVVTVTAVLLLLTGCGGDQQKSIWMTT